ncbi:MAG: hypothetical protein COB83_03910 [Gammaproteobacteria bacterium]|nr:MAG: hypothetical protein COB83_03910 [Gammaproteobacteria bacterium]
MDLFLLKKIISTFIMPINLVLILLILSVFYFKRRPAASFKYLISALLLLIVSSMPIISDQFMVTIEDNYQAFTRSSKPVDYIVVLGNWHENNAALPVTAQLSIGSLQRLVEALRIYKLHPEAKIITSGHHSIDSVSNAQKVKQSLVLLGIPAQKIITENFPKDTEEEAQLISPRVIGSTVVLVTNADHMPRAMKYFQAQGVEPIPAPTGHWVKNINSPKNWGYYIPSSKKLQQTTMAWYESLGRFVQWLKGLL